MMLNRALHIAGCLAFVAGAALLPASSWYWTHLNLSLFFGGFILAAITAFYLSPAERNRTLFYGTFALGIFSVATVVWCIALIGAGKSVPFGRYWDTRESLTWLLLFVGSLVSIFSFAGLGVLAANTPVKPDHQ